MTHGTTARRWRDNGCNVGLWFRFTPANLAGLASTIRRKR
jgi:hypothetical protein